MAPWRPLSSLPIITPTLFKPVYNGPLTDGPLCICAFLRTLLVQFFRNFTLSLYFVCVALFSCCTFSLLHSFHVLLSLHVAFISYCTFSVLHSFLILLFPCNTFLALHSFHVALISCCSFLSVALFFCVALFHAELSSWCTLYTLHCYAWRNFFRTSFLQKTSERMSLFHVLCEACNLEIISTRLLQNSSIC